MVRNSRHKADFVAEDGPILLLLRATSESDGADDDGRVGLPILLTLPILPSLNVRVAFVSVAAAVAEEAVSPPARGPRSGDRIVGVGFVG